MLRKQNQERESGAECAPKVTLMQFGVKLRQKPLPTGRTVKHACFTCSPFKSRFHRAQLLRLECSRSGVSSTKQTGTLEHVSTFKQAND